MRKVPLSLWNSPPAEYDSNLPCCLESQHPARPAFVAAVQGVNQSLSAIALIDGSATLIAGSPHGKQKTLIHSDHMWAVEQGMSVLDLQITANLLAQPQDELITVVREHDPDWHKGPLGELAKGVNRVLGIISENVGGKLIAGPAIHNWEIPHIENCPLPGPFGLIAQHDNLTRGTQLTEAESVEDPVEAASPALTIQFGQLSKVLRALQLALKSLKRLGLLIQKQLFGTTLRYGAVGLPHVVFLEVTPLPLKEHPLRIIEFLGDIASTHFHQLIQLTRAPTYGKRNYSRKTYESYLGLGASFAHCTHSERRQPRFRMTPIRLSTNLIPPPSPGRHSTRHSKQALIPVLQSQSYLSLGEYAIVSPSLVLYVM